MKNIYDQYYNKTPDTDNAANLKMSSVKSKPDIADMPKYAWDEAKKSEPQIAEREYAHKPSY